MAKAKHPGGRPRALADAKKRELVLNVLRGGGSRQDAANKVGVVYQTLLNETKQDKAFGEAVAQAETDGKLSLVFRVTKAAEKDWKAAAWMLERKHWQEFSKRNPESISPKQLSIVVNRFVNHLMGVIPTSSHKSVREEVERFLESLMGIEGR